MSKQTVSLRRCPFCHSHKLAVSLAVVVFFVTCKQCGSTGPSANGPQEAAQFWNEMSKRTNRNDEKEVEL